MKFATIEITGVRRAVFKTFASGDKEPIKTVVWDRIPLSEYTGDAIDDDTYIDEYIWVISDTDAVRSDSEMIRILKALQFRSKYRLWGHNETINVKTYK